MRAFGAITVVAPLAQGPMLTAQLDVSWFHLPTVGRSCTPGHPLTFYETLLLRPLLRFLSLPFLFFSSCGLSFFYITYSLFQGISSHTHVPTYSSQLYPQHHNSFNNTGHSGPETLGPNSSSPLGLPIECQLDRSKCHLRVGNLNNNNNKNAS